LRWQQQRGRERPIIPHAHGTLRGRQVKNAMGKRTACHGLALSHAPMKPKAVPATRRRKEKIKNWPRICLRLRTQASARPIRGRDAALRRNSTPQVSARP